MTTRINRLNSKITTLINIYENSKSLTQHAKIKFDENDVPISTDFDDIYYSKQDGIEETDYVFVRHNALRDRWLNLPDVAGQAFHIVETGFGTGLNFLVAWHNLRYVNKLRLHPISLTFTSFEKFPVAQSDLKIALKNWPKLWFECRELIANYPSEFGAEATLNLSESKKGNDQENTKDTNETVTLKLLIGDVNDVLPTIDWIEADKADAWFLDGFAPSKNPDMWQPSLYQEMARLSKDTATVATFTAVGHVRRGLLETGFDVKKYPGFGQKRDMVASRSVENLVKHDAAFSSELRAKLLLSHTPPIPKLEGLHINNSKSLNKLNVGIVGGGIAGLLLAQQLLLKSKFTTVTIYSADADVGMGASSNRQGAVYPLLQSNPSPLTLFYAEAYQFAVNYYKQWLPQLTDVNHGWSGVLQQAMNSEMANKFKHIAKEWPQLCQFKSSKQSSRLAGVQTPYESLYFQDGLWLNPKQLCQSLKNWMTSNPDFSSRVEFKFNTPITDVSAELSDKHDVSVLCAGINTLSLQLINDEQTISHLPLEGVLGQVSAIPSDGALAELKTVLCHKGYITPHDGDLQCFGATFERQENYSNKKVATKPAATIKNVEQIRNSYSTETWATKLSSDDVVEENAAIRATSPDHLPIVGPLFDESWLQHYLDKNTGKFKRLEKISEFKKNRLSNLLCLSGLGARGLTSGPLLADMLSDLLLFGETSASASTRTNCSAVRFLIKRLKQNKSL